MNTGEAVKEIRRYSKAEIREGTQRCIAESLAIEPTRVSAESLLIAELLGADSLDLFDVMFGLERVFGVSLNKEEFDLVRKIGLSPAEAIQEGFFTPTAIERLRVWLPALPPNAKVGAKDLRNFISTETLALIVESLLKQSPA